MNNSTQTLRRNSRSDQCQTGDDLVCFTVLEETGCVKLAYPRNINQEGTKGKTKTGRTVQTPKTTYKHNGSNTDIDLRSQNLHHEEEYLKKEYQRVMKDVKDDLKLRPSIVEMVVLSPTKKIKLKKSLLSANCSPLGLPWKDVLDLKEEYNINWKRYEAVTSTKTYENK